MAALLALVLLLPAKMGRLVYALVIGVETRMSGLKKKQVNTGEMNMSLYSNRNAGFPSIIMLHGFSADKDNWIRFARHLNKDFNLVIPDLAGHGDTGYEKFWNFSAPAQARRIASLMEKMQIDKAHLIGNSMGGFISAHFARMYPQKTLSATLMDPAGVSAPNASVMEKMLLQGRNPFEINNRQEFDDFYAMTMSKPPYLPGFVLTAIAEKYQQRREQLVHVFSGFFDQDWLDSVLHEIKVPVILLWGAEDKLIDVSSVDVWRAGIEDVQVKIWPGVGHLPMLEIPRECADVYRQLLPVVKT